MQILSMLSTLVAYVQVRTPSLKRDEGLETVEYALIAALIAVVAIGVIELLGQGVRATFSEIVGAISGTP